MLKSGPQMEKLYNQVIRRMVKWAYESVMNSESLSKKKSTMKAVESSHPDPRHAAATIVPSAALAIENPGRDGSGNLGKRNRAPAAGNASKPENEDRLAKRPKPTPQCIAAPDAAKKKLAKAERQRSLAVKGMTGNLELMNLFADEGGGAAGPSTSKSAAAKKKVFEPKPSININENEVKKLVKRIKDAATSARKLAEAYEASAKRVMEVLDLAR